MAVIESDDKGNIKVVEASQGESFRIPTEEFNGYRYVKLSDVLEYAAWRVKCALKAHGR